VGATEGAVVGLVEGVAVGAAVGTAVGDTVGAAVGAAVPHDVALRRTTNPRNARHGHEYWMDPSVTTGPSNGSSEHMVLTESHW